MKANSIAFIFSTFLTANWKRQKISYNFWHLFATDFVNVFKTSLSTTIWIYNVIKQLLLFPYSFSTG